MLNTKDALIIVLKSGRRFARKGSRDQVLQATCSRCFWSDQTLAGQAGWQISTRQQHKHSKAQLNLTAFFKSLHKRLYRNGEASSAASASVTLQVSPHGEGRGVWEMGSPV